MLKQTKDTYQERCNFQTHSLPIMLWFVDTDMTVSYYNMNARCQTWHIY